MSHASWKVVKFTKKKLKIFFNSNLHSIQKEKHNFEEIFFQEIFFLNSWYEGVLCQVSHLKTRRWTAPPFSQTPRVPYYPALFLTTGRVPCYPALLLTTGRVPCYELQQEKNSGQDHSLREAGGFGVLRNPCGAEVGGINSNISRFLFFFLFFLTLSFYISSILVVCNFATYQLEKFLRGLLIY